jgi:hypothetical protein
MRRRRVADRPVRLDLVAAKRRWAQTAPAAYQITVGRGCSARDFLSR